MAARFGSTAASAGAGMSTTDKSKAKSTVKSLISKEKIGGVFDDVPELVLSADDVDMKVWAVLATDDTLRRIATLHNERILKRKRGLRLAKADKIGDVGLRHVAESMGPNLLVRVTAALRHQM